jgi:hypothetical protein
MFYWRQSVYERVMRALTIVGGLALGTLFILYSLMVVFLGDGMAGEAGSLSATGENAIYATIMAILWPARILQSLVPAWRSVPTEGAAFALVSSLVWGIVLYALRRLGRALVVWWATRPILR